MKRLFRKICLILAFVLTAESICTANVYADERSQKPAAKPKELTNLTITNFPVPTAGVPFAKGVTVTSAEGVSWDIPVIWADTAGKAVTVPEAGKRYFPTFTLYIPGGYKIGDADANGRFTVKFPEFLTATAGADKFVYMVDPATQIIYIVYAPGYVVGGVIAETASEGSSDKDKKGKDGNAVYEEDEEDDNISATVRMYCDDTAINTFGNEFLEWLIDLVKNVVQPQAVNLLRDQFPKSLGSAEVGTELSDQIGLYIYYKTGVLDPPSNALAYVDGNYEDGGYKLLMGIDAAQFVEFNSDTGKWEIPDSKKSLLDNTIVHEMMHGFMDDYTRYGMYQTDDTKKNGQAFPTWFVEGIATAVENGYQYRYDDFIKMGNNDDNIITYTLDSVLAGYKASDNKMDLSLCNSEENSASAYSAGSLAVIYLGYLMAKDLNQGTDPITGDGETLSVDINAIRNGLDQILLELHGTGDGSDAKTLDDIIRSISGQRYSDTADYQNKFIKGADGSGDASRVFCTSYLTWLENYELGEGVEHANGSILFSDQNYNSPIYWDQAPTPDAYHVADEAGGVPSTADDQRANTTGGVDVVGTGNHDYTGIEEAAAKTDATAKAGVLPEDDAAAVMMENLLAMFPDMVLPETVTDTVTDTPATSDTDAAGALPGTAPGAGTDTDTETGSADSVPEVAPAPDAGSSESAPEAAPASDAGSSESAPEAAPAPDAGSSESAPEAAPASDAGSSGSAPEAAPASDAGSSESAPEAAVASEHDMASEQRDENKPENEPSDADDSDL